jgi:hypothetical protein
MRHSRTTPPNKPMHPTADTTAFKFLNVAGRRVIGGVRCLKRYSHLLNESVAEASSARPERERHQP